jgi:hypothetical protein
VDLAREYEALKKISRNQSSEQWLQQWETTYAEAERIKLPEIQDHRALFDFLMAAKSLDPTYVGAYHVRCLEKLETDPATAPSLYDAVANARNYLRLITATKTSTAVSHTAFSSFQNEGPIELSAEPPSTQSTASASASKSSKQQRQYKPCLCRGKHRFSECFYLIPQLRPSNWTPDEQIQKEIEQKLARSLSIREAVDRAKNYVNKQKRGASAASKEPSTEQSSTHSITKIPEVFAAANSDS